MRVWGAVVLLLLYYILIIIVIITSSSSSGSSSIAIIAVIPPKGSEQDFWGSLHTWQLGCSGDARLWECRLNSQCRLLVES